MKAAIYTRISQDRDGTALGVKRQEKLCRELASARGWEVVGVYSDNDISASKGTKRPEYERMVQDVEAGTAKAVVVYHVDRLYRRLVDLEALVSLADRTKVKFATVAAGDFDLNTASGRMVARMLASAAQGEVERASERIKAKAAEIAAEGRPHGGGIRPMGFSYESGNYHQIPEEADVIRCVVKGILEGRSMTSMVRELNEQGMTTTKGARWTVPTMGKVIRNPVVAGFRTHKGTTVQGTWEPIITPEEQELASRMLRANHRGVMWTKGAKPKYLLSGLMRCADCGGKLYFTKQGGGTYFCSVAGGGKGCVRIKKGMVEAFVWMSAMEERPRPVRKDTLGSVQAMKLAAQRLRALERRDALAQKLARGVLDDRSYGVAIRTIDADLSGLDAELSQLPTPQQGFRRLFGTDMTLEERREYLKSVTKSIVVSKGRVVEDRVVITWA